MPPFLARHRRAPIAALVLAIAAGCTGESSAPVPLAPQGASPSVHVAASRADAIMMVRTPSAPAGERGGTTLQLDEAVYNPRGRELEHKRHIDWASSNPEVATVDSTGLVTAQDTGDVYIVVDHKKSADSVLVRVIPVPVASVRAAGPDSLSLDDTASYTAAALDSVGEPLAGRAIAWRSSAPLALAIDSASGVAIALAQGTAIVTAASEGKEGTVTTKVWPQPVATIDVAPASASVALYRAASFTATLRDRRGKLLTGRVVTWRTSDPAVFTIDGLTGVVTTVAPGAADATAESEGKQGRGHLTVTNPVEARVLWVTRFDFSSAANVRTIIQKAKAAHFNAVYLQVRTSGDALYKSTLEPCSPRVCTTLGGATMTYDPLAVAIAEAGSEIEVHAWLNSMTAWISGTSSNCNALQPSTPLHLALANPGYILTSSTGVVTPCLTTPEYIWFSAGVPQVRTRLARVASEILRTYPGVKGIHLDRIRYPGTAWSYDTASVNAYKRANGGASPVAGSVAWANFRRGFVNAAVREVYDTMQVVRPSAVLSAAVWPIWKPPIGSNGLPWAGTSKGYDDYFQDTRAWTAGGYLDVAAPMTYPATSGSLSYVVKPNYCDTLDWECLLDDHRNTIEAQHHRQVYIGIGAIKGWDELSRQMAIARRKGATGISVYSYGTIETYAPSAWTNLANGYFRYPATIPAMPWKQGG